MGFGEGDSLLWVMVVWRDEDGVGGERLSGPLRIKSSCMGESGLFGCRWYGYARTLDIPGKGVF